MSSQLQELESKVKEYLAFESPNIHTWCSGCGNFGILNALVRALVLENIAPHECLICFDVGCNGNASDKINANTIHGLHGRVLSLAAGCAIGNHKLPVIAIGGDGATFSEGINHLVHAVRNNYNFVFICHNNSNYGLTTGQASATTRKGQAMNGTPGEVVVEPLNAAEIVLSLDPSFVARGFSGDVEYLTELIRQGLKHKGFAFIEVFQVCPTYNKATPQSWYWPRIKKVEEIPGYNNTDIWQARKIAADLEEQIAVGLLYHNPNKLDFLSLQTNRQQRSTTLVEEVQHFPISELLEEFK
jgi:2-oxoglutarate ferredoxin oxidoreductase subunit beta